MSEDLVEKFRKSRETVLERDITETILEKVKRKKFQREPRLEPSEQNLSKVELNKKFREEINETLKKNMSIDSFGDFVKLVRKYKKLNQKKLALLCGINTHVVISEIENNHKKEILFSTVTKVLDALGYELRYVRKKKQKQWQ